MTSPIPIGELAREFGVTARTLRFYEDKGLLSPRREGSNRLYSRRDRARLKQIILGKAVGFSLDVIKEMLEIYDLKDGQAVHLEMALSRFAEQLVVLRRQRQKIDEAIGDMTRTMNLVAGMLRDRQASELEIPREAAE
jgi:DNA-binding transcriptional MerR regulator